MKLILHESGEGNKCVEIMWTLSRKDGANEKILIAKVTAGAKGELKSANICKENILQAKQE